MYFPTGRELGRIQSVTQEAAWLGYGSPSLREWACLFVFEMARRSVRLLLVGLTAGAAATSPGIRRCPGSCPKSGPPVRSQGPASVMFVLVLFFVLAAVALGGSLVALVGACTCLALRRLNGRSGH